MGMWWRRRTSGTRLRDLGRSRPCNMLRAAGGQYMRSSTLPSTLPSTRPSTRTSTLAALAARVPRTPPGSAGVEVPCDLTGELRCGGVAQDGRCDIAAMCKGLQGDAQDGRSLDLVAVTGFGNVVDSPTGGGGGPSEPSGRSRPCSMRRTARGQGGLEAAGANKFEDKNQWIT